MDATLWITFFEDILFLVIIGILLSLRQRPYAILAVILFALILVTNIVVLRGFSPWFILVLPCLVAAVIILIARPFLPQPRVSMGVGMTRSVIPLSLFVFVCLTILSIIAIFFTRR